MIPNARVGAAMVVMTVAAHAEVLPVSEAKLANGLHVVLAPDPSASAVVVHVRYELGAGDETARQVGDTHLIERLLFAGSVHVKAGELEKRIDDAGGFASSIATIDRLSVFEQVPAEALELALWLEAERMAGFVDGITDAGMTRARAEIAAEWKSAYVEQPYGLVARELQAELWPHEHPNAHAVLGEVSQATRAGVTDFARDRITPARATLVIAGRFDRGKTLDAVKTYFGWIPGKPRPSAAAPSALAPLDHAREKTVADPVGRVVVAFRMAAPYSPDAIAIEVAARMLAGGPAARLERRLVDGGVASAVDAEIVRQRAGCELHLRATPSAGVDAAHVVSAIRDEIAKLRSRAWSDDEVRRAATALDSELVIALEGLAFRADMLAGWLSYAGTPHFVDKLRAMLRAVTPQDVQRAATRWLAETASVTVIAKGAP